LLEDFSNLKQNYEQLEQKYKKDTQETTSKQEEIKELYGKLPEENAVLHYNLGVLYAQKEDYQKAVTEFERVIELKPEDAESHYNLGVIYGEHLSDREKATTHFKKYLSLAPDDADADRVRKYILTWGTYEQELKNGK
jgi:tetratricopeptide (TPR) repeat protein